jgi:tetratricopeptide (TPR) repeat protein
MKESPANSERAPRWVWLLTAACALLVFISILLPLPASDSAQNTSRDSATNRSDIPRSRVERGGLNRRTHSVGSPNATAEEIVAQKLQQFAKNRRELVHRLAKRHGVNVPPEVERFFEAVERGQWEEIEGAHNALLLSRENLNQPKSPELHQIWRPIQEAWGIAREAHNWPAQKLLDYGEAVLGSLRPGMVYIGGTDPGCFIPTLLNETSEGERHITLTQNALADGTYLDYLTELYQDRFNTLTQDDSQRAFKDYVADAQKRFQHDQDFPDEPKQLKPGEDVKVVDGRVQVSGQVAVMAINEKLIQTLIEKNPESSFAIEQSFPFKSMYPDTALLGPIMELRAGDENPVTAERATESLDYWRGAAQQLIADPETPEDSFVRKAYAKLISEQAALLLDRKFPAAAEQEFQIALLLRPSNPEAVFRYADMLVNQNRFEEAVRIADTALKSEPNNAQIMDLLKKLKAGKK